ncbi:MAG: DUF951 domain-containing protein [Clostridia bacterium]|nr:DUF951 domain-containing protein [Clostridia bacterium]
MFELGTIITTKKNHPCGGSRWEVVRVGADYKIKCLTCGRVVMLTPDELKKRCKRVESAPASDKKEADE